MRVPDTFVSSACLEDAVLLVSNRGWRDTEPSGLGAGIGLSNSAPGTARER